MLFYTPISGWLGLCPQGRVASDEMLWVGARNRRSRDPAERSDAQQPFEMKHLSRRWKRNQ